MVTSADFIAAGDQTECSALSNAEIPDMCGHAIRLLTPGAAISGCENGRVFIQFSDGSFHGEIQMF